MKILFIMFALLIDAMAWTSEMNITGISEIDAAIPQFWAPGILKDANRESFWGQLQGAEGSRKPMVIKTGQLNKAGDALIFNTISQLMGAGVTGESVLKGNEEKLGIGSFTVTANVVRHAVAVSRLSNHRANYDQVKTVGALLKDWMIREMDSSAFTAQIDGTTNTLYAGTGNTAVTDLTSDSENFGPWEVEMIHQALGRQGAMPIQVSNVNGRQVSVYGCAFGEVEEMNLMQNSAFVNTLKESMQRFTKGNTHPIFNSALGMYRNMILYPYAAVNPLPQGTALRPETVVGATLTTAATTVTCTTDTTQDYTKFFSSTGTLLIGAEQMTYTGKTVNTFTTVTRAANGTTAIQHVPNAKITQNDIASVVGFGAESIFRAMPEKVSPVGQKDDYDEQIGLGIRAHYGDALKTDSRLSTSLNTVVMKCYSNLQGTV